MSLPSKCALLSTLSCLPPLSLTPFIPFHKTRACLEPQGWAPEVLMIKWQSMMSVHFPALCYVPTTAPHQCRNLWLKKIGCLESRLHSGLIESPGLRAPHSPINKFSATPRPCPLTSTLQSSQTGLFPQNLESQSGHQALSPYSYLVP